MIKGSVRRIGIAQRSLQFSPRAGAEAIYLFVLDHRLRFGSQKRLHERHVILDSNLVVLDKLECYR